MTTRVQKGGPVFRPVVKSRARPTSTVPRQDSTSADGNFITPGGPGDVVTPTLASIPSLSAPLTSSQSRPDSEYASVQLPNTQTSDCTTSIMSFNMVSQNIIDSSDRQASAHSQPTTPDFNPDMHRSTRNPHPPPSIMKQQMAVPIRLSGATSVSVPYVNTTSFAYPPQPQNLAIPVEGSLMGVFQTIAPISYNSAGAMTQEESQHALNNFGTESTPKLALKADHTVKPRRISGRKKRTVGMSADSTLNCAESTADEQNGEPSTEKAKGSGTRGKKTRVVDTDHGHERPSRKRKTARNEANSEGATEEQKPKRNRMTPSGTPRPRKSRDQSHPLFDANMDPGEEIDPTVTTMAALCSDTGQGRVSRKAAEIQSNHAAWKAQNKEKRAHMKSVMELKKYGRDEGREGTNNNQTVSVTLEDTSISSLPGPSIDSTQAFSRGAPVEDETGNGFDYSQDLTTSRFNVQVRIGPNGETIIDEESLVVDRTEDDDTGTYTHVVESDNTKFVNSGSYGKRYRGSRWSADETERFFDALSQFGENYELIAYVLPGRDRKSCKNKFKAEDKKNRGRIDYCLNNRIPVDVETLSRMTGKDFSGPIPEIRAPSPPTMNEFQNLGHTETNGAATPSAGDHSNGSKMASSDEGEIIGDAESFDQ